MYYQGVRYRLRIAEGTSTALCLMLVVFASQGSQGLSPTALDIRVATALFLSPHNRNICLFVAFFLDHSNSAKCFLWFLEIVPSALR